MDWKSISLHGAAIYAIFIIVGASGSVGSAAVQIANYFGAQVTGVCSTNHVQLVKSLGATVIDYKKEKYPTKTYDVIFDTIGKSPFSECLEHLKDDGYYLRAVHMTLKPMLQGMLTKKKVIAGIATERVEDVELLTKLVEQGKFKPVIDKTFSFEKIVDAHKYFESGKKFGNIVIKVV